MKNNQRNIICSWLLLFCFIAGQVMVFSHTHVKPSKYSLATQSPSKTTLKEKCDVCDAMHHTSMLISQHVHFSPVNVCEYIYKVHEHDFKPIALILAAGRAPPIA